MTTDLLNFIALNQMITSLKLNSLMGLIFREGGLMDSFEGFANNKAPGVDGLRKLDYEQGLKDRIAALSKQLRQGGYKPKPVRRVYIPKANGGQRPLGIPAFEDRIVQDRLSKILQAIWEPEFCECSYGFRPGRNAHQALKRVDEVVMKQKTNYVVEVDIKGFFQNVGHDWMMKFLKHRIVDNRFLRLLNRFLKGGVMEDGVVQYSDQGTPQGGLVSPVLSNIYLHYVLDLWFYKVFKKLCRGTAELVRYADDFVVLFQYKQEAQLFLQELPKRLAKFNLEVEPEKTKFLEFGKYQKPRKTHQQTGKHSPRTFSFLGFTHYMGKSRSHFPMLKIKTEGKRISKKLSEVKTKLKQLRSSGHKAMVTFVKQHLQGHIQYFGVYGNLPALSTYCFRVREILLKWLNRCSQRGVITWQILSQILERENFPKPRVVHCFFKSIQC